VDQTQLLKGVLDLVVLAVLDEADGYGYDIVRRLRDGGLEDIGEASVYGTLRRLFSAGFLSSYVVPSEEGPHRKYYSLTESGRAKLNDASKAWVIFADTMTSFLNGPDNHQPFDIEESS
jgi:PadR family transcriptional regulator PadR